VRYTNNHAQCAGFARPRASNSRDDASGLRLWVNPCFVGRGGLESPIDGDGGPATFTPAETVALASAIVVLTYRTP
jgi:hypothetical protein